MKNRYVKRKVSTKAVIDKPTGVMEDFHTNIKTHSYTDFFIAALAAWGVFKVSDGLKMKVFIHCIMVSAPSTAESREGNYFYVADVCNSVKRECKEKGLKPMAENNVRQYISKLVTDDAIRKTDTRGKYYINPKFGIKGVISEKTFCALTVVKGAVGKSDKIKPNKKFDNAVIHESEWEE